MVGFWMYFEGKINTTADALDVWCERKEQSIMISITGLRDQKERVAIHCDWEAPERSRVSGRRSGISFCSQHVWDAYQRDTRTC